jgi:hypothetical protein
MKRVDSGSVPHPLGKTEDALDSFRSELAAGVSVSAVALRAQPAHANRMSDSDNSIAERFPPPRSAGGPSLIHDRRTGSELGRQIPVDLQADADLNKNRGGPGH